MTEELLLFGQQVLAAQPFSALLGAQLTTGMDVLCRGHGSRGQVAQVRRRAARAAP